METNNSLPTYWVVKAQDKEEHNKEIYDYLNTNYGTRFSGGLEYYGFDGDSSAAHGKNGASSHSKLSDFENNPVLLSFGEFQKLRDEPRNWYVVVTNENREQIKKWWESVTDETAGFSLFACYGIRNGKPNNLWNKDSAYGDWKGSEISTEKFLKITKPKVVLEAKKILYYKLSKKEYLAPARLLAGSDSDLEYLRPDSLCIYNLRKADVLDKWFEKVFEESEKTLIIGSSKLTVKITKDGATIDKKLYKFNDLTFLKSSLMSVLILGDKVSVKTFKVGCSNFSMNELDEVIKTCNNLRNGQ